MQLLSLDDLPDGFDYPRDLIRLIECGLIDLEPWMVLSGEELFFFVRELARHDRRELVPFARRRDSDDIVCFDVDLGDVVLVQIFDPPGARTVGRYPDFRAWLRQAFEDYITWDDPL